MKRTTIAVACISAIIFLLGAGYIVYTGRPVMKIAEKTNTTEADVIVKSEVKQDIVLKNKNIVETAVKTNVYIMADVQKHNVQSDCWSAIGGDVYDLTSWVTRHPGGERAILSLCGTDGTSAFNDQHGDSRRPKSTLVLLKIGSLQ